MVNPTWEERDLPVLRAAVDYCETYDNSAQAHHLEAATGFDEWTVRKALTALTRESPKLFGNYVSDGYHVYQVFSPTGEARRRVGLWPTPESLADRLVLALAQAAEREPDEERRGWLKRTAEWLGSAGRDVAVDVTAAVISRQVGGA